MCCKSLTLPIKSKLGIFRKLTNHCKSDKYFISLQQEKPENQQKS